MIKVDGKDDSLFVQRLSDLKSRCTERYSPEFTNFLDGRQLRIANEYLMQFKDELVVFDFGGFKYAERKIIGLFPRDIYGYSDENGENDVFVSMFDMTAVKIQGSGFSSFSHRDCLGSVLALGIKRETVGDIFVSDDGKSAYVCLTKVAADFVLENLESVARDKVKCVRVAFSELPVLEKKYAEIAGTVASERLDCIIGLALNVSREKAKQLIASGLVSVNHFEELRCDFCLCEGDILSVRGYGRFVLHELGSLTRKGRTRATIHKMI